MAFHVATCRTDSYRCEFADNTFNQPWLDHVAFAAEAHLEGFMTGFTLGTGVIHMVKVQMTPLGALPNSVQISHCTFAGEKVYNNPGWKAQALYVHWQQPAYYLFAGNPSYVTGTVFIRAAEEFISDYDMDNLPGTTSVKIVSSNFTSNYCRYSLPDLHAFVLPYAAVAYGQAPMVHSGWYAAISCFRNGLD